MDVLVPSNRKSKQNLIDDIKRKASNDWKIYKQRHQTCAASKIHASETRLPPIRKDTKLTSEQFARKIWDDAIKPLKELQKIICEDGKFEITTKISM